jgi:membrane protease YdiL (CAAX protease family)
LLFRGLLQRVLRPLYGRWSLVVANLLFTAAYLPTQSLPVILLMAAAGLLFGWSVERTGSLWPAMAGHGLLAVTATVIWPAFLG